MRGEASLRGARVLELGCGTGACGLYAAPCGATEVLLTDGSETLQPLIDTNVASNPAPGCAVRSQRYLWGEPLPAGRFDLAIASDCSYFYEEEAHAALAATCAALLDAGTRIVCAHEHRSRGPKFWADEGARWDATDEYLARFAAAAANAARAPAARVGAAAAGGARQLATTRRTARCLRCSRRDLRKFALRLTGSPL